MTFDKDYIAVITGACGGIGESVAHALAKEGLSLALLDNNATQLATLVATLQDNHPQPIAGFTVDVADDRCVAEAFTAVGHQLGPVGYLVNGWRTVPRQRGRNTTSGLGENICRQRDWRI